MQKIGIYAPIVIGPVSMILTINHKPSGDFYKTLPHNSI